MYDEYIKSRNLILPLTKQYAKKSLTVLIIKVKKENLWRKDFIFNQNNIFPQLIVTLRENQQ